MSDGTTHDLITCVTSIPVAILFGFLCGTVYGWCVFFGYCFAGFMFNGDLDTVSKPYYRWWLLRFIWIPYRKRFKHRSIWTHGFLRGTFTRLIVVSPLVIVFIILLIIWKGISFPFVVLWALKSHIFMSLVGIELGAMSHTAADMTSSWWKRKIYKLFGIRLVPGFVKWKNKKD